jgi:hypothetical protein
MRRAQLSLSMVEAGVGVVLILAVSTGFVLDVPAPDDREPQLDAYARDTLTVLAGDGPRHQGTTRLGEVLDSSETFERERDALDRRVDRILPDNLFYRVTTPYGAVGFQRPAGVVTGRATATTLRGDVTVRVWYS